jgi:outer membrane protein assembly factor BamB
MDKKPQFRVLKTVIMLFLVLGYCTERAEAGSPWLWDRVLKQDKAKDALSMPTSLFIDGTKELYYVVDSGNNRLLSFNRKGELLNIFNAGKALSIPSDMVKTEEDGVWIVEKGRNSLSYIDLKEKKVRPNTLTYKGELVYPDRIETDSGLLYVLNKATGNIISYSKKLIPVNRFSSSACPWGFVDFKIHQQKIWALDQANKTIRCFNLEGKLVKTFELGDSINFPVSLAIGPTGFIYVLDRQRRNIVVYDRNGIFKYRFLEKGIARGQLYYPSEIRFDPWGGLCLVDEGNARVEIFNR